LVQYWTAIPLRDAQGDESNPTSYASSVSRLETKGPPRDLRAARRGGLKTPLIVGIMAQTVYAGARGICDGKNIMMIVLGYFLIAAVAVIAASAIIGFFLTNLLILSLQMMDRSIRLLLN
jgi:hypothetical protein